jgi:hypothetical protein
MLHVTNIFTVNVTKVSLVNNHTREVGRFSIGAFDYWRVAVCNNYIVNI